MTARNTALIATAKAKAIPVTSCVAAKLQVDHLLSDCSWDELAALVIVLAESADPARLRTVCEAPGDQGLTAAGLRAFTLKTAHTEYGRLRQAGYTRDDMPAYLARLESEYQRDAKRRKRERAA